MRIVQMVDLNLTGARVLIREDFNTPLKDGKVSSDARLIAALPTINKAREMGAGSVRILSHLGRPKEGEYSEENSLAPVARRLSELAGYPVRLVKDYLDGLDTKPGEVVLCENVRFNKGEKSDDEALGRRYAALCDIFVMDAFATAHRAQASTHAVARFAPAACAGPLLHAELQALSSVMDNPQRPLTAVLGGAKVSTKLEVLETLCKKVNTLIVGGGIANNFIKAAGYTVGNSLYEPGLIDETKKIMRIARDNNCQVPIPKDVVVGKEFSAASPAVVRLLADVREDEMILDIGPETCESYARIIAASRTILWNGPVGAFELEPFSHGTEAVCRAIARSSAYSLAGGGDTLAAVEKFGATNGISYLSTGGGAFLEFLEGKTLPAVAMLMERAKENRK